MDTKNDGPWKEVETYWRHQPWGDDVFFFFFLSFFCCCCCFFGFLMFFSEDSSWMFMVKTKVGWFLWKCDEEKTIYACTVYIDITWYAYHMYTMNCTYTVIIVAIIMITPCPCTYIGISITYSMWIFVTIIYAAFLPDTIILPRIFSHTHMMFFRRLFYHYCFEISWVNTRQGTNIYPQKWDFKDDFQTSRSVGYLSVPWRVKILIS